MQKWFVTSYQVEWSVSLCNTLKFNATLGIVYRASHCVNHELAGANEDCVFIEITSIHADRCVHSPLEAGIEPVYLRPSGVEGELKTGVALRSARTLFIDLATITYLLV